MLHSMIFTLRLQKISFSIPPSIYTCSSSIQEHSSSSEQACFSHVTPLIFSTLLSLCYICYVYTAVYFWASSLSLICLLYISLESVIDHSMHWNITYRLWRDIRRQTPLLQVTIVSISSCLCFHYQAGDIYFLVTSWYRQTSYACEFHFHETTEGAAEGEPCEPPRGKKRFSQRRRHISVRTDLWWVRHFSGFLSMIFIFSSLISFIFLSS